MATTSKPVSSRESLNARKLLACWPDDVRQFQTRHQGSPFHDQNPLYAIPPELLEPVRREMPNLLAPHEVVFEQDLAKLCMRHHVVCIFHGRPANYYLLNRPAIPVLSDALFFRLGWDRYITLQEAWRGLAACSDLLDPLCERSLAYIGWLLANPQFLGERDQLRDRWDPAVEILGTIPAYPVHVANDDGNSSGPQNGRDVLADFIGEFNAFYARWQLQRMATWDLPEPCGANLTGHQLPSNSPVSCFTIQLPTSLRLPAHFPLRNLLEDIQRQQTPEHLRPWLAVQDQQHRDGLRHGRFGTMFRLAFYLDTVLVSRYRNRLAGFVGKLDEAFADFLGVGSDSIKKIRLKMAALRAPQS